MSTTSLDRTSAADRTAATTWIRAGLVGGALAGILFAMFEMVMAAILQGSEAFFMPLRMIGAMGLGTAALDPTSSLLTAGAAGIAIHMALSMTFGLAVAAVLALVPALSRTTVSTVASASIAGFGLWIVDFFVLAPAFGWTWFPDTQNVAVQFVAHTFMFGAVLGLILDRLAFRPSR